MPPHYNPLSSPSHSITFQHQNSTTVNTIPISKLPNNITANTIPTKGQTENPYHSNFNRSIQYNCQYHPKTTQPSIKTFITIPARTANHLHILLMIYENRSACKNFAIVLKRKKNKQWQKRKQTQKRNNNKENKNKNKPVLSNILQNLNIIFIFILNTNFEGGKRLGVEES